MSSESLWNALRLCWIDVCVGQPDVIAPDARKNVMGAAFQANADMMHILTKLIPVESANSMSIVEKYHAPLQQAFNIIRCEAPNIDKDTALQIALKAINGSVGPKGLVPTLLDFGALSPLGLPTDAPSPSRLARSMALHNATEIMSKHFASRQVRAAQRGGNGLDDGHPYDAK